MSRTFFVNGTDLNTIEHFTVRKILPHTPPERIVASGQAVSGDGGTISSGRWGIKTITIQGDIITSDRQEADGVYATLMDQLNIAGKQIAFDYDDELVEYSATLRSVTLGEPMGGFIPVVISFESAESYNKEVDVTTETDNDITTSPNTTSVTVVGKAYALPKITLTYGKGLIYDDFASLDTATWDQSTPAQVDVASGVLEVDTDTAIGEEYLETDSNYDVSDMTIQCQLVDEGNTALASYYAVPLWIYVDASNAVYISVTSAGVNCRQNVAGTPTTLHTETYSSTDHAYLRIAIANGTTTFQRSADGETWVDMHSVADPITYTTSKIRIGNGTTAAEASSTTMQVDKFRAFHTLPQTVELTIGDYSILIGTVIVGDEVIVVDAENKTVTVDGVNTYYMGYFPTLPPGSQDIVYTDSMDDRQLDLSMTYQARRL